MSGQACPGSKVGSRPLYSLVGAVAVPMSSPFEVGSWLGAVPEHAQHITCQLFRVRTARFYWLSEYSQLHKVIVKHMRSAEQHNRQNVLINPLCGARRNFLQMSSSYEGPGKTRAEVPT